MRRNKFQFHPRKFYEMRARLDLTQTEAALVIGVSGPIIISKWENGHDPIPRYAVTILDLLSRIKNPKDYRPPSGK